MSAFDPESLANAERTLSYLREHIKLVNSYAASPIPSHEVVGHVKRALISLINNDATGFLSFAIFDRLNSVLPDLEKLVELMRNESRDQS